LGEDLAGLELGGDLGGPEDAQPFLLKMIDDAQGERLLRANDCETDPFLARKARQPIEVVLFDIDIDAVHCRAGIARGAKYPLGPRRLGQLPRQRMLATTLADNQDLHGFSPHPRRGILTSPDESAGAARGALCGLQSVCSYRMIDHAMPEPSIWGNPP